MRNIRAYVQKLIEHCSLEETQIMLEIKMLSEFIFNDDGLNDGSAQVLCQMYLQTFFIFT